MNLEHYDIRIGSQKQSFELQVLKRKLESIGQRLGSCRWCEGIESIYCLIVIVKLQPMKVKSPLNKLEEVISKLNKYKFQIILLLFFLIFYEKIQSLLDSILVIPLLSTVKGSTLLDILFYISGLIILINLFFIWRKKVIISHTMIGWLSVFVIVYLRERFFDNRFSFLRLESNSSIAYSDITLTSLLIIAYSFKRTKFFSFFYLKVIGKQKSIIITNNGGFYTDFPIAIENEVDDDYDRLPSFTICAFP